MGCGSSKNKVHIVGAAPTSEPTLRKSAGHRPASKPKNKHHKKVMGSQDSLGGMSNASERIGSGTSKVSKRTMDSGFDDNDNVITEHSDPTLVKQVEEGFDTPKSLDLGITGQPVQQRLSAKDRERMEEKNVLAALHEEGLIQRPMSRANFGVSFEVVAEGDGMFGGSMRPPARLAKLEKRKKKKKPMTQEEIERKLARAEERRKEREQQRLERIQAVTNKSDVQNALDNFMHSQQQKDEQEQTKQDIAAERREQRLREMRDKLRAKQEKIDAARRRKLAGSLDETTNSYDEESPFISRPKLAADGPAYNTDDF